MPFALENNGMSNVCPASQSHAPAPGPCRWMGNIALMSTPRWLLQPQASVGVDLLLRFRSGVSVGKCNGRWASICGNTLWQRTARPWTGLCRQRWAPPLWVQWGLRRAAVEGNLHGWEVGWTTFRPFLAWNHQVSKFLLNVPFVLNSLLLFLSPCSWKSAETASSSQRSFSDIFLPPRWVSCPFPVSPWKHILLTYTTSALF